MPHNDEGFGANRISRGGGGGGFRNSLIKGLMRSLGRRVQARALPTPLPGIPRSLEPKIDQFVDPAEFGLTPQQASFLNFNEKVPTNAGPVQGTFPNGMTPEIIDGWNRYKVARENLRRELEPSAPLNLNPPIFGTAPQRFGGGIDQTFNGNRVTDPGVVLATSTSKFPDGGPGTPNFGVSGFNGVNTLNLPQEGPGINGTPLGLNPDRLINTVTSGNQLATAFNDTPPEIPLTTQAGTAEGLRPKDIVSKQLSRAPQPKRQTRFSTPT